MQAEYLLFNLVVIIVPFVAGFFPRTRYVHMWPQVFGAALIVLVPYIIWDIQVTGRHWWFNELYTMDWRLLGLPPGEWLFFITVPFSCLYIWYMLPESWSEFRVDARIWRLVLFVLLPLSFVLWLSGKEYSALAALAMGLTPIVDLLLKTHIFKQLKTLVFIPTVVGLTFIFNTWLTWRPVVLYGVEYQLDVRLGTIPLEDFFYGMSHLCYCAIVFEWLKKRRDGAPAGATPRTDTNVLL